MIKIKIDPKTAFGNPVLIQKIREENEARIWRKNSVNYVACMGRGCEICDDMGRIDKDDPILD